MAHLTQRKPPNPLIASSGVPAWATIALDALCGSGALDVYDLDGLDSNQLVKVAAAYVRATAAAVPFDATAAIMAAREPQTAERHQYRPRERAKVAA